jgi:peptide deformylase
MPDEWIRQWGDPALHEPGHAVTSFDELLAMRARRLARHLVRAQGAGLAATQVGVLQRMFAYRVDPEDEPQVLINPRIVASSEETSTFIEACLSFNTVLVTVERPVSVEVTAQTVDGEDMTFTADDYAASLMQHEIDHLDGIITLDRAAPDERRRVVAELSRQRRAISVAPTAAQAA